MRAMATTITVATSPTTATLIDATERCDVNYTPVSRRTQLAPASKSPELRQAHPNPFLPPGPPSAAASSVQLTTHEGADLTKFFLRHSTSETFTLPDVTWPRESPPTTSRVHRLGHEASRFTEEQIIAIVLEQEAGAKTADVCRKCGISSATFYKWKGKYGGLDVSQQEA
jgi:putative transposase